MKLGIITISFNQAEFLEEAIQSVQLSDTRRLSYVIVDPGSTDGSRDIILKYKDRFSEIIFEPDEGPADGLNKGFAACDADVYGFLNSDDRFEPRALDYVLSFFEQNEDVDVLIGAIKFIDARGKAELRKRVSWSFSARDFLQRTCVVRQQATFFRRRTWLKTNGFNINNRTCWDAELLVGMALSGATFEVVHKVLGCFRAYDQSITGAINSKQLLNQHQEDLKSIRRQILDAGVEPDHPRVIALKRLVFRLNPYRRFLEFVVR